MVNTEIRLIMFFAAKDGEALYSQQKSLKCSTWMQSQKCQNDLGSFPGQTIWYHSNPIYAPTTDAKKLKLNSSMKTYKTF